MPRYIKKWETTRKLGRGRYVLRYGIAGWAIPVGVFLTGIDIWQHGFSLSKIIIAAIIWPVGGYFFGMIVWSSSERRYRRFQEGDKVGIRTKGV